MGDQGGETKTMDGKPEEGTSPERRMGKSGTAKSKKENWQNGRRLVLLIKRERERERDKCEYPVERALKTIETADRMKWILDSGCTNHITGCRQAFVEKTYVSLPADQRDISKNYSLRPERPVRQTLGTLQTLTATQEVTSVARYGLTPSPRLRHVLAPS